MVQTAVRSPERAQARRRSILEGARTVISVSGFRETTIKSVAETAGCSAGLIYSYFDNRDELLRAAFVHAAGHELDVLKEAIAAQSTAAGAVEAMVETFVSRALRGRQLAAALLHQAVPEVVERERLDFRLAYSDALVPHLAQGIETGEIPRQNPRIASQAVNGAVSGALQEPLLASTSSTAPGTAGLVKDLTEICLRATGVVGPA